MNVSYAMRSEKIEAPLLYCTVIGGNDFERLQICLKNSIKMTIYMNSLS